MCNKSDWDRYKNRYEPNLSNVLNPEGIDITLNRMIISQIQMLVERCLIHRLPKNYADIFGIILYLLGFHEISA